jgi:host factor-I protein
MARRLRGSGEAVPGDWVILKRRRAEEMMKNQVNVQDQFLNRVRRDRLRVAIELTTGRKLEGILLSFDNFSLILRGESDQLLYKHAISTISVSEELDFLEAK